MHTPPSVEYPAGNTRWHLRAALLAWSVALAINLAWLLLSGPGDWRPWSGLALTMIGAALALRFGGICVGGALVWDGDVWWWEHDRARVRGMVSPELDFQRVMLLRFVPDAGRRRWFVLEHGSNPARWLDLRRAVHGSTGRGPGVSTLDKPVRASEPSIEP